jgi:hypothetical protein
VNWKDEKMMDGAIVFIYYCNKLREGKFLEGGPVITLSAFDIAVDLVDSGFKIDEDFCIECCIALDMDVAIGELVMSMQELGLPEMLRISEEIGNKKLPKQTKGKSDIKGTKTNKKDAGNQK